MTLRGVVAVANAKLLSLSRSPIALIVCGAFVLLVLCLPELATQSRVEQVRQASSWLVSAAGALLLLSALLVPISRHAPAVRLREGRLVGARRANLGHGAAGLLFLVFQAGLLALIAWGWISLKYPQAEISSAGAVVRNVVYRNPDPFALRSGESWSSGEIVVPRQGGSLQIELVPRLRFVDDAGSAPASRPGPPQLELSLRAQDRVRTRRIPLSASQARIQAAEFEWSAAGPTRLQVELKVSGNAVACGFDRGSVVVLGVRSPLFSVVIRALLVVGCMAAVLLAATQWFSNFVGPLIAVSAAVTLLIAALAIRGIAPDLASSALLSSVLPEDPVAALRRGHETGWRDVGRGFVTSVAAIVLSAAASVHGPERREP